MSDTISKEAREAAKQEICNACAEPIGQFVQRALDTARREADAEIARLTKACSVKHHALNELLARIALTASCILNGEP